MYLHVYNLGYLVDLYREAYDIFAFYSAPGNTNYTIMPGEKCRVGILG